MNYCRFAHLEEKPKRKPVWVGDSYMVYTDVEGREEQRNKHERTQSSIVMNRFISNNEN